MGIHVMGDLRASQFMCGNAYRAQRSVPAISPSNLDNLMAGLWWAIGAPESRKWVRASAPDGEAEASTSIRVSHPLVRSTSQLRAQHRLRSANDGARLSARRHRSRTKGRYPPPTLAQPQALRVRWACAGPRWAKWPSQRQPPPCESLFRGSSSRARWWAKDIVISTTGEGS